MASPIGYNVFMLGNMIFHMRIFSGLNVTRIIDDNIFWTKCDSNYR